MVISNHSNIGKKNHDGYVFNKATVSPRQHGEQMEMSNHQCTMEKGGKNK